MLKTEINTKRVQPFFKMACFFFFLFFVNDMMASDISTIKNSMDGATSGVKGLFQTGIQWAQYGSIGFLGYQAAMGGSHLKQGAFAAGGTFVLAQILNAV